MKTTISVALAVALCALLFAGASGCMAEMGSATGDDNICLIDVKQVPRMSADELKSRLSDPSLALIDVRASADWDEHSTKIKGARREAPRQAEEWASKYDKEKTIVLYCA